MCYSAQILAEHKKFCKLFNAKISAAAYFHLYWHRPEGQIVQRLRAMDLAFLDNPQTDEDRKLAELVRETDERRLKDLGEKLEAQLARLAKAESDLAAKRAKGATKTKTLELEQRRAADKVAALQAAIDDSGRTVPRAWDSRLFPGSFTPVLIVKDGERVLMPMRFRCRPVGVPASFDEQYPGTYNANRDSLGGFFWRRVWGHTHGIVQIEAFYESVLLHRFEQRALRPGEDEQKIVIEFRPDTGEDLLLACVWSHWEGDQGEQLDSFAFVTEDPPPEVEVAGHNRCIIPIDPADVDTWLNPDPADLDAQQAVLDRRRRPFYLVKRVPK
nr:SOS response-associated peptidase family protein [uncultured Roseateles sp.]